MNCVKAVCTLHTRSSFPLTLVHAKQTILSPTLHRAFVRGKSMSVDTDGKRTSHLTHARYCHGDSKSPRKRPRLDRVGYQHEDKIAEIRERFDRNFNIDEFFRGAAHSFLNVTNCICDDKYEELEHALSPGAQMYAQWIKDQATHSDTCHSEVIFPTEEKDIFSLVINNVNINDSDPDLPGDRTSTVQIKVTVTYGKNHRVIFGIPDSYLCSFAVFIFQRTFVGNEAHSDWLIDRLQYYPPR